MESTGNARATHVAFSVPRQPHQCREVRERVAAFARRFRIADDDLAQLLTAVGEAVANAIEHSGADGPIEVHCDADGERIVTIVRDGGVGFDADALASPPLELPTVDAEHGRGLPIMRRCSDIFSVSSIPGRGTVVVVGRLLRRRA